MCTICAPNLHSCLHATATADCSPEAPVGKMELQVCRWSGTLLWKYMPSFLAQEDNDGDGGGGGQVQGTVLEPCKLGVTADLAGGAGDVALRLSDLRLNLSPDVAELAAALQASVLEPLVQPPPDRCSSS